MADIRALENHVPERHANTNAAKEIKEGDC